MTEQEPELGFLKRRVSRRQAIKVGGLAAAGLLLSKPLIETIRPGRVFAQYGPGAFPLEAHPVPRCIAHHWK